MSETGDTTAPRGYLGGRSPGSNVYLSATERAVAYVAVFLAPYGNFRFSDAFFTASDFLFCVSLFLLLLEGRIRSKPLANLTGLWLLAFALLFVGIMTGSLVHGDPERGMIVVAQYLFAYIFLMIILIRNDPREIYRLAGIFLVSVILIDIHGIITFYAVGYVPGHGKGIVTGGRRLATVLGNPNLAAAINALTLPILLFYWTEKRIKTYVALFAITVIIVAVVLTSSNSGLFVTAMSLIVFITFVLTPRLLLRLALSAAIFVGVLGLFGNEEMLPQTFQDRVLGAVSSGDISEAGTFESRAALMEEALQLISDDSIWLVGLGADQFRQKSVQRAPVHNLYLLLWVEGGLLALIGWTMFSGVGMLLGLAVRRAGGGRNAMAAVIASIAALLIIAFSNPHMYARYWTIPVILTFGLAVARLTRAAPRIAPPRSDAQT